MPTQTTDLFSNNSPAIWYTNSGESWTIAKNVHVGSNFGDGIRSTYASSELVNKGTVYSNNGNGVFCTGGNSEITNQASGTIYGYYDGIYLD